MRQKELKQGIAVQNEKGDKTYGNSIVAAHQAVYQTAYSRMILPILPLFTPAVVNYGLVGLGLYPKGPLGAKMLEVFLCTVSLTVALPCSIALFKSRCSIESDKLEE
jgi:hypothetical protein